MVFHNVLILIGTIWPLAGVALAIFIAFLLRGWQRWVMLFAGPVVFLIPCYVYGEQLGANGNMLFVALMAGMFVLGVVYYPALLLVLVIRLIRKSRAGAG